MIYFTSDFHLSHLNIIDFSERPFTSVDQMDETIISNMANAVTPDDTLYLLGDILWKDTKYHADLIKRINCKRILVSGNHDAAWLGRSKGAKVRRKWLENGTFHEIHQRIDMEIDGQKIILNHFPFVADGRHDDRFSPYRPDDDGHTWLLHGHVHQSWLYKEPRQLNVGVDVWDFQPVCWDWVRDMFVRM